MNNSGLRGAYVNGNKWIALITVNKVKVYLGTFNTLEEAARAYDKKAYELHGDKAILNFPEEYLEMKEVNPND